MTPFLKQAIYGSKEANLERQGGQGRDMDPLAGPLGPIAPLRPPREGAAEARLLARCQELVDAGETQWIE